MQTIRTYCLFAILFAPMLLHAQTSIVYDDQKLDAFAHAIARSEGFGIRHAIPTRYHNPGDLKVRRGCWLPGMVRIGKGGHVVFRNDAAGWAALRNQIAMALDGRSRVYRLDMNFRQVGKKYARDWRRWSHNVAHHLGVSEFTTLREYFVVAPNYIIPGSSDALREVMVAEAVIPVLVLEVTPSSLPADFLAAAHPLPILAQD